MKTVSSIDAHIKSLPKEVGALVQTVREVISQAAPTAVEAIKYGIPTFLLNGKNLVHFAGYKGHIGFYPAPSGIEAFKKDLARYSTGKGTLQFKFDEPLPLTLIQDVVRFRVKEITTMTAQPKTKKK